MALSKYTITNYDGSAYEVVVGDGDRSRSFSEMPDPEVAHPGIVRFPHILFVAARRIGAFTGTFDDFQNSLGSFDAQESGESTTPPED